MIADEPLCYLWRSFLGESNRFKMNKPVSTIIATVLIRAYQLIVSPLLGANCRFAPTCSQYALEAIERYGLLKGTWLGCKRLLRCHPWCDGGFDPVP